MVFRTGVKNNFMEMYYLQSIVISIPGVQNVLQSRSLVAP